MIGVAQECQRGGCTKLLFSTDPAGTILEAEMNGGFTRDVAPFTGSNYATSYAAALTLDGRLYFANSITGASYGRSVIKAFLMNNDLSTTVPSIGSEVGGYSVFPNPCTGSFTLHGSTDQSIMSMRLFNTRGMLVADYSGRMKNAAMGTATFALPHEAGAGLYQLVLSTSTSWTSLPLVVE